jgi:very-short-patch-repair endonuclease
VFRGTDVVGDGLLTPDALRSSAWRRLFRGIYADASLPESHGLRVRSARLLAPAWAVFSGRTAAYLHGATALVGPGHPVEISIPAGRQFGPVSGLRVRRVPLPGSDVTRSGAFAFTTGLRTALDIARTEPVIDSVPALDVLLAGGVVALHELRDAAADLTGVRGARTARQAASWADPRAESPPESRLRVILALAGLHAVPQFTVRDATGAFAGRVDLAFPAQRVAVEYDGAWHAAAGQLGRDRRRLNRLAAAGWVVFHVTARDLYDVDALVAALRALLASRKCGESGR